MVVGLAGAPVVVGFAFACVFALACWAMQLLTKLRRFKKWMAEYLMSFAVSAEAAGSKQNVRCVAVSRQSQHCRRTAGYSLL